MMNPAHRSSGNDDLEVGLGHNRAHIPPEELAAELEALKAAEARTGAAGSPAPELVDYVYEVRFYPGASPVSGELQAFDLPHARRVLNVILGVTRLPVDTRITQKDIVEQQYKEQIAARSRYLLKTLTTHHQWLQGNREGQRADLSAEDLAGANLEGRNLTMVSLANANLSGANLKNANLTGADLTGADLSGADLQGSDLSNASLAEANLIGSNLCNVILHSTDFWRANLARAQISPDLLHEALGCKT
ncbi:pentapeptide repeat-containing protein [Sneathiella limimaris]|uniref:pentapeptide repeat-containing protein n=1 Tax=Sneathiella limimaris TaxID=1964213 RepID=UPI0019CF6C4F|nr:pentapeptide repeat-containing protein [Sneathiella limimaris]